MKPFVLNEHTAPGGRGKRALSLLLAAAVCAAAFAGCGKKTEAPAPAPEEAVSEEDAVPEGSITVPYTSLDSVNPFFCTSLLNSSLLPLVYRSLYRLNGGFTAEQDLALSETVNGAAVQVRLPDVLTFSDGVLITASDVLYSFTLAKDAPLYKEALRNVDRCEADGSSDVTFYLDSPDVNVLNILTFPIVKRGTADDAESLPVGAGRFAFRRSGARLTLTYNRRFSGAVPAIGEVGLQDVTTSSSLMHMLDVGDIDCFYTDLSDGTAKRSYAGSAEVYLNNLVFLGVNHASYRFDMADVRRAFSLALSRSRICENAFTNHARASFYPVNTSWAALGGGTLSAEIVGDADVAAADALLYDAIRAGTGGDTLHYRLICREDSVLMRTAAALIAEQFSQINVELEIGYLSDTAYRSALFNGEYDFYLGEIKLTANMDLSPFFSPGGAASYGLKTDGLRCDTAYALYRSGQGDLQDFLESFSAEMPFIPLLFRNGQFCYSRRVTGSVEATEEDLYRSFADWRVTAE